MVDSASDGDARRRPMAGDSNSATDDKVLFSQLMRERTKEAHTLSDLLVNAKLGATCSNADVRNLLRPLSNDRTYR